jgi:hypothetical protein
MFGLGVVAHDCNSGNFRGRDRRIKVQGQPGQKLMRPYLKNNPGVGAHACGPSYLGDGSRRIRVGG